MGAGLNTRCSACLRYSETYMQHCILGSAGFTAADASIIRELKKDDRGAHTELKGHVLRVPMVLAPIPGVVIAEGALLQSTACLSAN